MTEDQKQMDYKQEELNRLHRLICKKNKECETARLKRTIIALLGFTVFYFLILYYFEKPTGWNVLGEALVALVFSGIHVFVNALIFGTLANKGRREEEYLKSIRQQIKDLENDS